MPWTSPSTHATLYDVLAADWNELVNDLLFLKEIGYAEVTSPVSVTATTVGTAQQLVTLGAITYEAVPTLFEFFSPRLATGAAFMHLDLRDGTTVLGTIASFIGSSSFSAPAYAARRLTPTAASHSYNIAAWNASAATGTVNGSSGGAAGDATTFLPMFMRATRIPT